MELYQLLIENMVDCVWLYDLTSQRFKYVSPSVQQLLGVTVSAALEAQLDAFLAPASLENLTANQSEIIYEHQEICLDGAVKPVEISARLISDHEAGTSLIMGVTRDLSSRKQLESRLQQEIEEKEKAIRSLRQLAQTDELTGLYNRYYFDRRIDEEIERAERYESPLSMILFDLDHFKDVNDIYGHDMGDQVLISVARQIQNNIRKPDILARWGGEEFILLTPHTDLAGAAVLAEKLRLAICNNQHGVVEQVSASFGLAEHLSGESYGNWFRRADEALYQAKCIGRNRVVSRSLETETPVAQVRLDWKQVWECGHQTIDVQHRKILELANALLDQALTERGSDQMNRMFTKLIEHIQNHFADEEKILAEIGYPETARHTSLHRNLVRKIMRLNSSYLRADLKPSALFSYIVDDVIIGHLLTEDVLFFPYIG